MDSTTILIVTGVVFFLILILMTLKLGLSDAKEAHRRENNQPVIHTSGIYSIVRKSPRDAVLSLKPTKDEIMQYLLKQSVDNETAQITKEQCEEYADTFSKEVLASIETIEAGDSQGVEFYFYRAKSKGSPCKAHFQTGGYITREEIYTHPQMLPPFHIGCELQIIPFEGGNDINDTRSIGMLPVIIDGILPKLPDWRTINKQV